MLNKYKQSCNVNARNSNKRKGQIQIHTHKQKTQFITACDRERDENPEKILNITKTHAHTQKHKTDNKNMNEAIFKNVQNVIEMSHCIAFALLHVQGMGVSW